MKPKRFLLVAALALMAAATHAQGILEILNVSQPNDVYSSIDNEAAVIVRCHQSIALSFSSTMDKTVEPYQVEQEGTDNVYYIEFPTGNRYRGRTLTIMAPGYNPQTYALDLQPKQLVTLQVTDPNALVDAGCYRGHRNRGVQEIKNSNYDEARAQFVIARQCSDVDTDENEKNIALVDSLIHYRQKAEEAYKLLDYQEASRNYTKVIELNAYDTYASNRNTLCVQAFQDECGVAMSQAEFYFNEKDYEKAKELFQRVVTRGCQQQVLATQRLNDINKAQLAKKHHSRVLTYELRQDTPFGLSYGKYNMHKMGGFIAFDFSKSVFEAMQSECQYGDKKFPEVNAALGWTVKIASPVWIHFTPVGGTIKLYYGEYEKKCYPNKDGVATDEATALTGGSSTADNFRADQANVAWAWSPVVGITVKYSYFAIRATYQYRFCFTKDLEDFFGTQRLSVGVGIAF